MRTFTLDRFIVMVVTASLGWSTAMAAAPSQNPMLSPLPVAPNVMFTLDDSGSMLSAIMPEQYASSTASDGVAIQSLTPQEQQNMPATVDSNYGYTNQLVPTRGSSSYSNNSSIIDDAKRRSSAYNTIYYNPNIRYLPWKKADGTLMPYPTPTGTDWIVRLDPVLANAGGSVTVNLSKTGANAFTSGGTSSIDYTAVGWCAVFLTDNGAVSTDRRPGNADNRCTTIIPNSSNSSATTQRNTLRDSFDPAVFYEFTGTGSSLQARRISLNEAVSSATFGRTSDRADCTVSGSAATCTKAQEWRNFATWFVYYRTRLLLAKAGVAEAFSSSALRDFRLGYGALNNPTTAGADGGEIVIDGGDKTSIIRAGVRDFPTIKPTFYDWLFNKTAYNGTALRKAIGAVGTYYQREDARSPWSDDPGLTSSTATAASFAGCRRSFHILTTDGYWSEGATYAASQSAARANVDGSETGPEIKQIVNNVTKRSYQYKPSDPANARYKDDRSDMLGDVAMYYWNRDLAPNVPNSGFTTDKNPAWWQHMVNYTVGLGTSGSIDPATLTGDELSAPPWPSSVPAALTDSKKADDLIHAAYNSRGKSLSAANSTEFAKALSDILLNISDQAYPTGGVGISGGTLTSDFAKYVPSYVAGTWKGDLKKYLVNANTGAVRDAVPTTVDIVDPVWSANAVMKPAAQRNIFVWKSASPALPFTFANLDTTMRSEMGSSPAASDNLINYLRGDTSLEGSTYRTRASKLGDIVNSTPTYVKNTVNLQYTTLPMEAAASYNTFLKQLDQRSPVIFIGANDGMLHAFADGTGEEVFAFVPRAVLPKLSKLSNIVYAHQFFVDGPMAETHAYLDDKWSSILVASMGAGAKGLFAIDITNTSTLSSTSAGSKVMWEFNSSRSTDGGNIGHIFSEVEVGPIQDGQKADGSPIYKWVALVGNGVDSTSNKAQLLIVDIKTGDVIKTIDTFSGTAQAQNGLGGVRSARDAYGVIQAAYAGDLQGNVWRFNLSGGKSSTWNVAFGGKALFTATDPSGAAKPQPITAPPSLLAHPKGGTMVVVATGKLIDEDDRTDTAASGRYGLSQVQSIYGIWDKTSRRVTATQATAINKSNLVKQSIGSTNVGSSSEQGYYNISTEAIDWKTKFGWYMDMTLATGQRVIYAPQLVSGYVFVNSVVPASTGVCGDSSGYNGLIDALTGTVNGIRLFDTNGDGIVDKNDNIAQWYASTSDGRERLVSGTPRQEVPPYGDDSGGTKCKKGYLIFSAGNDTPKCVPLSGYPGVRTWRVIPNPPR